MGAHVRGRGSRIASGVREWLADDNGLGMTEGLIGALLLTVLGLVVPGHWGLLDVQPHPFWILVVAIAIRYGSRPGYVVTGAAVFCYAFFVWVAPGFRLQAPTVNDVVQPFFLLVGGLVISELVRSQHQYVGILRDENARTREALRGAMQRQQALAEVNRELEKRLVTQSSSLNALYDVARRLDVLDVPTVYAAMLAVLREVFDAEACAVYRWQGDRLELAAGAPPEYSSRPAPSELEAGLVGRAYRDGRVVSIRERVVTEGAQALDDEPVMLAGPLVDRERRVLGVVAVERLPFLKLNAAGLHLFESCLDWFSTALANAEAYQQAQMRAAGGHSADGAPTDLGARDRVTSAVPAERIHASAPGESEHHS
jgi:hypothetical protein